MKLYPYQVEGATWLANNRRAYLADEMGLGKTAQAVVAARLVNAKRPLVICPASAVENWRREWSLWQGKAYRTVPGIVSYAKIVRHADLFVPGDHDLVILDEAHYVKTPSAKRTRAALKLAAAAKCAWLLSGTPMPNHPGELWPVIRYLWPEVAERFRVKNAWQWFDKFTKWTPTVYGPRAYAVKNGDALRSELRRFMKRRRLSEVALDLPPLRVDLSLLPCDDRFSSTLDEMLATNGVNYVLEAQSDDPHVSRLRRFLGEYKAPRIAKQICDELVDQQYKKVVVLAYHHDTLDALGNAFAEAGIQITGFRGGASSGARQFAIDCFTEDPTIHVFLAQQSAAGIAINLQAAHEIVLVEPAWSPEDNYQAIKRIHRIGQESPCRARVFAVAGSLDDAIMGVLVQKTRMIEEVIN